MKRNKLLSRVGKPTDHRVVSQRYTLSTYSGYFNSKEVREQSL